MHCNLPTITLFRYYLQCLKILERAVYKVFTDVLENENLLSNKPSFGIIENELLWFTDYIFNRSQVIEISGTRSESECITSGVPQGTILGPLLFIMSYDDICSAVKYSDIILYADDTVLVFADKNVTEIERISNQEMENIADYCRQNKLIINTKKGETEIMLFGTAKRLYSSGRNLEISYNGVKKTLSQNINILVSLSIIH